MYTNINNKKGPQKKHHLGTVSKKITQRLNMFDGTNLWECQENVIIHIGCLVTIFEKWMSDLVRKKSKQCLEKNAEPRNMPFYMDMNGTI